MKFTYHLIRKDDEQYAEITGMEGKTTFLRVPGELGGFPVRSIGKNAFSGRDDLEEIHVPDGVKKLGSFAFYSCKNLRSVFLTDSMEDLGDGVLRSCGSLREICIQIRQGRFRPAKDLLADFDSAVRIRFLLPDGEALLFFPAYLNDFDEDTMARMIHPRIEGCGYAFREAVTRKGIDFLHYDKQFPRTEGDGWKIIGEVAAARILRPYRLSEDARRKYEAALLRVSEPFLLHLVKEGRKDEISCLASRRLLKESAVPAALQEASGRRNAELCGILMEYTRNSGRKESASAFLL